MPEAGKRSWQGGYAPYAAPYERSASPANGGVPDIVPTPSAVTLFCKWYTICERPKSANFLQSGIINALKFTLLCAIMYVVIGPICNCQKVYNLRVFYINISPLLYDIHEGGGKMSLYSFCTVPRPG